MTEAPGNNDQYIKRLEVSLALAYKALRAVVSDRKHGCLCDNCLRDIVTQTREVIGGKR